MVTDTSRHAIIIWKLNISPHKHWDDSSFWKYCGALCQVHQTQRRVIRSSSQTRNRGCWPLSWWVFFCTSYRYRYSTGRGVGGGAGLKADVYAKHREAIQTKTIHKENAVICSIIKNVWIHIISTYYVQEIQNAKRREFTGLQLQCLYKVMSYSSFYMSNKPPKTSLFSVTNLLVILKMSSNSSF